MTVLPLFMQSKALPSFAQPEIIGVALFYFAVCAGIALWAVKRTKTVNDFFIAGQGIGLWPLAIGAMASTLSGFGFIGGPGLVYSVGIGAVFLVLPASITNSLSGWVLAKRIRLLGEIRGLITVPDAIGARYRSPAAQGVAAIAILIATIGYVGTNFLALGLIIDAVFHSGLSTGIWIGAAVILAYTAPGGILAGIYIKAFASTLVFVTALRTGDGMHRISETILSGDPTWFGPWGRLPPLAALSFFFVFGLGSLGQPHVIHKFYMLKDVRKLRWYPLLMTGALLLALLLYVGVGLAIKAAVLRGDIPPLARPDDATPTFLLRFASPLLAGIVFSGVTAAIMSTVNSFLSVGAAAFTHDLPVAVGKKLRNELLVGRLSTVVLTLLAVLLALKSGVLVALLGVFGWGLFASTLVPSLAIGLCWPGATKAGAIASISVGLLTTLLAETLVWSKSYTFPAGVTASGLALVLSLLTFFIVSWFTRLHAERDLDPDVRLVMEA
jgi:Na+/proline symporter